MVGVLLSRPMLGALSTIVAAATLGVVFGSGCGGVGAEGTCPALEACGGDPTGTWSIQQACEYQAPRPTQPTDVMDYMGTPPIPPTLTPPQPQPTQLVAANSGDWCSSLDYNGGTVNNVTLWHDVPTLQPGSEIAFNPDQTYTALYKFSTQYPGARNTTHFAPICLTANGGDPTCADLEAGLTKFYAPGGGTPPPPPTFNNIQCTTSPADKGCDCTYYFALQVVDQGTWSRSGDTISQQNSNFTYNGAVLKLASPAQTMKTTFCRPTSDTSTLYLTGANGASISDLVGLRTLSLKAM
jgi:hypothetical protein